MDSPTTLTFDSPKILKSALRCVDDRDVKYTTTTVRAHSSRQTTSLDGAPGTPNAVIDWKRGTFEISGARRHMADLKTKRVTFSSSRYWSWFDCEEYKVKYAAVEDNTWTVFSYSGTVLATFTSKIRRMFNDNALPVLRISSAIRDEDERLFIILVLLYSETKRLESLKERPLGAIGGFLDNFT
ncbi:hypothetical protein B0H19DRAFT_531593 [Mycena capillaripes]|nr:hypothetical protein B0H19DRAFT_531593 [Mycena capillaripes]